MRLLYGIFIVIGMLFVSSCSTTNSSKDERVDSLDVGQNFIILNDVMSEFSQKFPPQQGDLFVVSENKRKSTSPEILARSAAEINEIVAVLLRKNRYESCNAGIVGGLNQINISACDSEISAFVVRVEPDLLVFQAGVKVNDVLQVSRYYMVSSKGDVLPTTGFYVREGTVIAKSIDDDPLIIAIDTTSKPKLDPLEKPKPQLVAKPKPQLVAKPKPQLVAKPKPQLVEKPKTQLVEKPKPQLVAAPSVKVLERPIAEVWQVQVMASVDKEAILALQKTLKNSGVASEVVFETPFYKLRAGPYTTKKATWAAQKSLTKRYVGAFVVKVSPP
jgi:hypothetical protein